MKATANCGSFRCGTSEPLSDDLMIRNFGNWMRLAALTGATTDNRVGGGF